MGRNTSRVPKWHHRRGYENHMKVLRLISGLDPQSGGPPVSAVNSAIAVMRCGIDTHFAFAAANPDEAQNFPGAHRLAAEGIPFSVFPLPRLLTRQAASVGYSPALGRFIAQQIGRFDVIHVQGAWTYPTVVAVRLARRAGPPVVLTPHEALTAYDLSHARLPGLRVLKQLLKKYYVRHLSAVVFSSTLEKSDSAVEPMPANWIVVSHPVYDDRVADGLPRAPAARTDEFQVGMLGRIHKKKIFSSPSTRCAISRIALHCQSRAQVTLSSPIGSAAARQRSGSRAAFTGGGSLTARTRTPSWTASIY